MWTIAPQLKEIVLVPKSIAKAPVDKDIVSSVQDCVYKDFGNQAGFLPGKLSGFLRVELDKHFKLWKVSNDSIRVYHCKRLQRESTFLMEQLDRTRLSCSHGSCREDDPRCKLAAIGCSLSSRLIQHGVNECVLKFYSISVVYIMIVVI